MHATTVDEKKSPSTLWLEKVLGGFSSSRERLLKSKASLAKGLQEYYARLTRAQAFKACYITSNDGTDVRQCSILHGSAGRISHYHCFRTEACQLRLHFKELSLLLRCSAFSDTIYTGEPCRNSFCKYHTGVLPIHKSSQHVSAPLAILPPDVFGRGQGRAMVRKLETCPDTVVSPPS